MRATIFGTPGRSLPGLRRTENRKVGGLAAFYDSERGETMYNDPFYSDPTEHHRPPEPMPIYSDPTEHHRPPEPMPTAYRNPYELSNPYDAGVPVTPPPPPKQRHIGLIVISVSLLCVVMILGGVIFGGAIVGTLLMSGQRQVTQATPQPPTPAPTPAPTAPSVRPVSSSASDIYNAFIANGLGGTNRRDDNNWSCCTYTPEGGALVWTDSTSGYPLDIATFKSMSEAAIDAGQLDNQNFASSVVQTCLLSYDKTVPTSVVSRYLQVMQRSC